jgi:hypothetical protein
MNNFAKLDRFSGVKRVRSVFTDRGTKLSESSAGGLGDFTFF